MNEQKNGVEQFGPRISVPFPAFGFEANLPYIISNALSECGIEPETAKKIEEKIMLQLDFSKREHECCDIRESGGNIAK